MKFGHWLDCLPIMNYTLKDVLNMKGQKILFLNVRSILANLSLIQADFAESPVFSIGLTETWLRPTTVSGLVKLKGYNICRLDRKIKKRGGGVLLFLRDDLTWESFDELLNFSDENIELLTVVVKRSHQKTLCISVCYIPPTANYDYAVCYLDKCADKISSCNYEWVLGGDFNVDLNPKSGDGKGKKLLYSFRLRNALMQMISVPTRVCATRASVLDHIYVNNLESVAFSGTAIYGLSDHNIVFAVLKRECLKKNKITFSCRNTRAYSREILSEILLSSDWEEFENCNDPDVAWELMETILIKALDICAPLVILDRVKDKDPWISSELLALIRERDELKGKVDKFFKNDNFIAFKKKRNAVKRLVIKAKRDYIVSKLCDADTNPRKYWVELKNIFLAIRIKRLLSQLSN